MTEETTGGRRSADDLEDELVGKVLRLEPERRQIVLSTHDLTKRFGNTLAVDRLNLTVHRGDVFGFLGPNGAGKTTTIRMIVGLIYPTSGYATVVDHRVPADKTEALQAHRRLRRGARLLRQHERSPQPAPHGLAQRRGRREAHRRGARHRGPARARRLEDRRLLARHEAAPGHRQRPHQLTRARHLGRAHERPRPAGHEGRARARARARAAAARPSFSRRTCCTRSSRSATARPS